MILFLIMLFASSFGVTWLAVGVILRRTPTRLLDIPNHRSSHTVPTPRSGGLGVLMGLLAGGVLLAGKTSVTSSTRFAALGALALVGVTSFVDDIRPVRSRVRLLIHLVAAIIAVWSLGPYAVITIPLPGTAHLDVIGPALAVLSVVWCVGLINAFNFLDGIDGIAGVQGATAGLAWTVIGLGLGSLDVAGWGIILAAGAIAFLCYNWQPARIFLGDVGSTTFGFALAMLPLAAASGRDSPGLIPGAGLLVVWPFVFDATFTFIRRLLRREDVLAAHREHLYQRLVRAGLSHAQVARLYLLLAALDGVAAVGLMAGWSGSTFLGWISLLVTVAVLLLAVHRAEAGRSDSLSSVSTSAQGGSSSAS